MSFDGKQLHRPATAPSPVPGKVALWTKSDSVTRFDQIEIQLLP